MVAHVGADWKSDSDIAAAKAVLIAAQAYWEKSAVSDDYSAKA